MVLKGYNPEDYKGMIWWNEVNPTMRLIWGTQKTYDDFIRLGGTWQEYEDIANQRMEFLNSVEVMTYEVAKELPKFELSNVREIKVRK